MKLSICMMVKNEEKNLGRCLESLQELVNKIPSEIIVVDTGSTDNTVKIAREYTERIYHHQWNNNFSEMRNITIDYATGEWVFIIDADEVLINASPIIDFLESKHSSNVVGAAIFLKNAKDYEGIDFGAELITPRIFKKDSGIRYEGIVHNMPIVKGVLIEVHSVLHHFGYVPNDPILMEAKFERTKKLIEEALRDDPFNIYYNFQLSVTYDMHGDSLDSYNQIKKTYQLISQCGHSLRDYLYIYSSFAKVALSLEYFQEVINICREGLSFNDEYLDLHFFMAGAYLKLGENHNGLSSYKNYLLLVDSFQELGIRQNSSIQHYTLNMKSEAYCNSAIVSYRLGDFENALKCADEVIDNNPETSNYYVAIIEVYLNTLLHFKKIDRINTWYDTLQKDEHKDFVLMRTVQYYAKLFREINELDVLDFMRLDVCNVDDLSLKNSLANGFTFYNALMECDYKLFGTLYLNIPGTIRTYLLEVFAENHFYQKRYSDFYDDLGREAGLLGLHFRAIRHGSEQLHLDDSEIKTILSLGRDYYHTTILLLLSNQSFLNYLTAHLPDNAINQLMIELSTGEANLSHCLEKAIESYNDQVVEKNGWNRVFRHYLKTLLTIKNNELEWKIFDRYNIYLFRHLLAKYQQNYLDKEIIENFTNNEEAYGVALIRSGYFGELKQLDWLLVAGEFMPVTVKYISSILTKLTDINDSQDSLEVELSNEISKLINSNEIISAKEILNEGLSIRPNSRILLDLKSRVDRLLH